MANMINLAIQYLSTKSCSEMELREYLRNQCSEVPSLQENIDSALMYLKDHHLINDLRVAEQLALRHAHRGNRFIIQVLKQRHINECAIKEALLNIADEKTRALNEGRHKLATLTHLSPEDMKSTLVRFLSGRQFSLDVINMAIEHLTIRKPYKLKHLVPFYEKIAS